MELVSKFDLQDRVRVDDSDIIGTITLIEWRGDGNYIRYEVSWFVSGDVKYAVFDEWRLAGTLE